MPNLREIRRRIRGISNMSQITRAMEMVAASKMRRAQERVTSGRPYADRLRDVLGDLAALQLDREQLREFPLLAEREVHQSALLLITPDRGLSGALNVNLMRRATQYIRQEAPGGNPEIIAVGKKGRDFMTRTHQDMVAQFIQLGDRPSLEDIRPIARAAIDEFLSGRVDAVHLIYPQFVNAMTQKPELLQLLPITRPEGSGQRVDYIFEPDAATVLGAILPRYVEVQIYQAVLDNVASFYSAQMVAMRNATDNAEELVDDLTLSRDKARQAQITNEVAEISAGANAFRAQ